ncbi:unnamed protein product [Brachionus calyciflorus]|uniref:Uncharacterized protein n=1 Tax=Brachionus calyciflorus TaxID=104777 RepID=A0A814F745_9BILA|nr:unnamed protein product [Brachionus calyciflorus]
MSENIEISDDIPSSLPSNLTVKRKSSSKQSDNMVLPWDRFSHWVHSILVVTFDIEMGQSIETIYPTNNHVKLSQQDKTNICYLSFPDSNSGFLGDSQFHFRFKLDSTTINTNSLHNNFHQYQNLNQSSKSLGIDYEMYNRKTLAGLEVEKNFMYGYVYFRQVKDKTLKRGYFQK